MFLAEFLDSGSLFVRVCSHDGAIKVDSSKGDEKLQDVHGADGMPCCGLYVRWLWGLCDAHGRAYFNAGLISLREDRPCPE